MGNRFDAYLAGRLATEPTLSTTKDGKPWVKFRLAVDDRSPNRETGEWETSQTIFHDVVAFGRLAERTVGTVHSGDAVIAQGELRFRSYEGPGGMTHAGTQFVATRLGPDILLSEVTALFSKTWCPQRWAGTCRIRSTGRRCPRRSGVTSFSGCGRGWSSWPGS